MTHFMNPSRGKHLAGGDAHERPSDPAQDIDQDKGQHAPPNIHIDSHANGHTVTIHHSDGTHTVHEHQRGDADGIKAHIDHHIGGSRGQSHGVGDSDVGEEEGSGFVV